jgi:hypothetical protein
LISGAPLGVLDLSNEDLPNVVVSSSPKKGGNRNKPFKPVYGKSKRRAVYMDPTSAEVRALHGTFRFVTSFALIHILVLSANIKRQEAREKKLADLKLREEAREKQKQRDQWKEKRRGWRPQKEGD